MGTCLHCVGADPWNQTIPVCDLPRLAESQKQAVEKVCGDEKFSTWVAEVDGEVLGFVSYILKGERGEVELLAVHPHHQNCGVGTTLNCFALRKMKEGGVKIAEVGTGGDEGHGPARRSYEKAGYTALPLVRFYKKL